MAYINLARPKPTSIFPASARLGYLEKHVEAQQRYIKELEKTLLDMCRYVEVLKAGSQQTIIGV